MPESDALLKIIRSHIETHGPMSVARYIEYVLNHPEHGYYAAQDPLGRAGDFITAPEISQMFGEMIGAWIADCWIQMGQPSGLNLLECGPGRGTLMADILRGTAKVSRFHNALSITFMETNEKLRELQKEALEEFGGTSTQCVPNSCLSEFQPDNPCIILGNEFLDVLPAHQLVRKDGGWKERVIALEGNELVFGVSDVTPALLPLIPEDLNDVPEGRILELSPQRNSFIRNVCDILKQSKGAALFIDYGEKEVTFGDSLRAIGGHEYKNVLDNPGRYDVSINVDFGALREVAVREGIKTYGPIEQGAFLHNLGITARAQALMQTGNKEQAGQIRKDLHRLTHSSQMGALFKVLGMSYGTNITPAGF